MDRITTDCKVNYFKADLCINIATRPNAMHTIFFKSPNLTSPPRNLYSIWTFLPDLNQFSTIYSRILCLLVLCHSAQVYGITTPSLELDANIRVRPFICIVLSDHEIAIILPRDFRVYISHNPILSGSLVSIPKLTTTPEFCSDYSNLLQQLMLRLLIDPSFRGED